MMRSFMQIVNNGNRPLFEVVLYRPIDLVLRPYLAKTEDPAVHTWLQTNFRNWLLKQPNELYKLTYAPPDASPKAKKAFQYDDLYDVRLTPATQTMLEHFLDFFEANPNLPRLDRMSVENVEQAADRWVKAMNAKFKRSKDDPKQVKTLMEYPNGYRMVELLGQTALGKEGAEMGHCVGGYCDHVTSGRTRIFSLRDANNQPHATIELSVAKHAVHQIKGRRNAAPVQRYWSMIRQFLESIAANIEYDYRNVGLLHITDDEGNSTTLTQEQFRDIIHNPADQRSEWLLKRPPYSLNDDEALGLFTALYGDPRLSDKIVRMAFQRTPGLAVQTVVQHGNKLTDDQLAIAMAYLTRRQQDGQTELEELLRVVKPDLAMLQKTYATMPDQFSRILQAVAKVLPASYRALLAADPTILEQELKDQSSGPFFAFAGSEQLTPAMIQAAFTDDPVAAMKHVKKLQLPLNDDDLVQALIGVGRAYGHEETPVIKALLSQATLRPELLSRIIQATSDKILAVLVPWVTEHQPSLMSQSMRESALLRLKNDDAYREYLKAEPHPSAEFQRALFDSKPKLLQFAQNIDPSLFQSVYEKLRPKAVALQKAENKTYKTKNRKTGQIKYFQKKIMVNKTEEELHRERLIARRAAIETFSKMLYPLLREPEQESLEPLNPAGQKMQAAKAMFSKMGKLPLFDLAVRYIDHKKLLRSLQTGVYNKPINLDRFATQVKTLPIKDIVDMDTSSVFGVLVNQAPERVPEFLKTWAKKTSDNRYGKKNWPWNKFDMPVEKDRAFEALEHVWASTLSEEIKDAFATVVLKRFKPAPAKLFSMLKTANNADVTEKILRKTAKPSPAFLDFILDTHPQLLLAARAIPEATLVKIFREHPQQARRLMDRDLRGYAPAHRSRWASYHYERKLDTSSTEFAHYQKAAEDAGTSDMFNKYVRQSMLDEQLANAKPATVIAHLGEYSLKSLLDIGTDSRFTAVLPVMLNQLPINKLVRLINSNLLRGDWHRKPTLQGVSAERQRAILEALFASLKKDASKDGIGAMLDIMLKEGFTFDDELLKRAYEVTKKDVLLRHLSSDDAKNWVADNYPHEINEIDNPTPHVVKVLFDELENSSGKSYYSFSFKHNIEHWFRGNSYGHYGSNPELAKMIRIEASKRGAQAIRATRKVFQDMMKQRRRYST